MRAFIRREFGLVDAAEVIEINFNGGYGGSVSVRTAATRADGDGHVVARLMDPEPAYTRSLDRTTEALDADLKASAEAAQGLAKAIIGALTTRADGAVIDYNRDEKRWNLTQLS